MAPPNRARVIPLGVRDLSKTTARRRPKGGRTRILFVGRLERRKGVDLFLEAAQKILPRLQNVEFHLIGKDTPNTELAGRTYREIFQNDTHVSDDLKERVQFMGAVSEADLISAYAEADIFCLPSRYESFGLVLLEAMVFGMPVVAANIGGMREIVRDGENGFLFESENSAELARVLERLIENPALRSALGSQARADYENRFSLEVIVPETLKFYTEIAKQQRQSGWSADQTAERFSDIVRTVGTDQTVEPQELAASLVGIQPPSLLSTSPTTRSYRIALRTLTRRAYNKIKDVRLIGSGAREAARFHWTYRTLQSFLFGQQNDRQAILNDLLTTKNTLAQIKELSENDARQAASQRARELQDRQDMRSALETISVKLSAENSVARHPREPLGGQFDKLQSRLEFTREEILFELRALLANQSSSTKGRAGFIKSPAKLDQLNCVRLNIGCGHIALDDYINVDQRDLPGVDIVADATNIPLPAGSVDEIFSSHLLEHFPIQLLTRRLLPHWMTLLKPGGKFRAIVPDGEEMLRGHARGEISFDDFRTVTYGLQEYDGDFHFNMFSRESLRNILESSDFTEIEYNFVGRRNGLCFDMEIVATKRVLSEGADA